MTHPRLRIGQLAGLARTSPDTLRYYERLGLLPRPRRTEGGYRVYDRSAADRVTLIRKGQALGLSLREIREVIEVAEGGRDPCDHVRAMLAQRLAEVDARMADLRALRKTLEELLQTSERAPRGPACVCRIIEASEPSVRATSALRRSKPTFHKREVR